MADSSWRVESGGRLDKALKVASGMPNKKAKLAIFTGKITVNGTRQTDGAMLVKTGDTLALHMAAPNPARTEPYGVQVVFKDSHVLVLNKPAGLLSAPVQNSDEVSALKAAQRLCKDGRPPKTVHRLDKLTSGLMVFARGTGSARALRAQLDQHLMKRTYRCVVVGEPQPKSGMISSMLLGDAGEGKGGSRKGTYKVARIESADPATPPGSGKHAITRFKTLASADGRSALEVRLRTGRTHQIRIHLAEMGHPVLGERIYRWAPGAPRQALHAATLGFTHPLTSKALLFEAKWPEDLAEVTPLGADW